MTRAGRLFRDGAISAAFLVLLAMFANRLNNPSESFGLESFYVIDGDSLKAGSQRFRLSGIDAPEFGQQCQRDGANWACGRNARRFLVKLLGRGTVSCRGDRHDMYGRLLVVCEAQGLDINGEMVRRGMAVSYGGYGEEEAAARQDKAGLWAGTFERPRDYRRERADVEGANSNWISALRDMLRQSIGAGR